MPESNRFKKILIRNTVTNYMALLWRMISAVFITRLLFLGLPETEYGFWALLWTVFGYSLLLDFGFGATVQKYSAELTADGEIERFSRLISAVISSYLIMAIILILASAVGAYFLDELFELPAGAENSFRLAFLVFGVGAAMVFPTGVFPEILNGLKRADLRNYVMLFTLTSQLVGIWLIMHFGLGIFGLIIFTVLNNLTANCIMAIFVFRKLPGFKIRFSKSGRHELKQVMGFSFYAYLFTLANMVIFRTDRMVLGVMMGMPAVALYQVGTRIPELVEKLTTQFQENLGPVAATLYHEKDFERLKWILLKSIRLSAFTGVCAVVAFFQLAPFVLKLWLKLDDPAAIEICRWMLVSVCAVVVVRSTPFKFLQMAGYHKLLALIVIIESVLNLGLSIYFIDQFGVMGVVWGTLIPSLGISLLVVLPLVAKYAKLSVMALTFRTYLPLVLVGGIMAVYLHFAVNWTLTTEYTLVSLAFQGTTAGIVYMIAGWLVFLNKEEKGHLLALIRVFGRSGK